MTATGMQHGGVALLVDGLDLLQQRSHGLEGAAEIDGHSVRDAALDASAVVGAGLEGEG